MGRTRRAAQHEATAEEIKTVARRLMRENGTSGLSVRAIAREIGLTPPALYHYYPALEDLITALIVDAFAALGDAVQAAVEALPLNQPARALWAGMLAYRSWALAHPVDFQLIYGNPIPGYTAPAEVTVPLAARPFESLGRALWAAAELGQLNLPVHYQPPPQIAAHLAAWMQQAGYPPPPALMYALITGWTRMHGMVMLELFDHTPPTVGDPTAFYEQQVAAFLRELGLDPPG